MFLLIVLEFNATGSYSDQNGNTIEIEQLKASEPGVFLLVYGNHEYWFVF